jgi:hypothetical protein
MRRWTLRCWSRKKDMVYTTEFTFLSEAQTIEDALEFAYRAGFACLQKIGGRVQASAKLNIRMSSKSLDQLLVEIVEDTLQIP